jgi:hypothetical protein
VEGLGGLSCTALSGGSKKCTVQSGVTNAVFTFGATNARFFLSKREDNDGTWNNSREYANPALITGGPNEGQVYSLQIPQRTISHTINVADGCSNTSAGQSSGAGGQSEKDPYWLDTAPKVGGYSQNQSVTGNVTRVLDSDTTSISTRMYCRVGANGARMDQAQFWVKDKNGAVIYTSDAIACKTPTQGYFDEPTGCQTNGKAGPCYQSSYDIPLPAAGAPYSVRTAGAGKNGPAIDNYIFDAYLRIAEHKSGAASQGTGGANSATSCNPSAPNIPTLASAGACVVGRPHSFTMQSDDPNNDSIRYGLDWNADGSVDEWRPPTGYLSSGTIQAASRTYATAGAKVVKILAQDDQGLNSGWATLSFTCAASATAALDTEGAGADAEADADLPSSPALDLRAVPSLVRRGDTTKIHWSAQNVSSCTVSGTNNDAWNGLASVLGGQLSKPITGEVIYTLSCLDLRGGIQTKQAAVRIIPSFHEI